MKYGLVELGEPVFKIGDKVVLTCEGKAECGATGTVVDVRRYTGPPMYADFECKLHDVMWGGTPGPRWWVRETWLALLDNETGDRVGMVDKLRLERSVE